MTQILSYKVLKYQTWSASSINLKSFERLVTFIHEYIVDQVYILRMQPRPQSNFKKIALAPHEHAGNFYLI